jgi:hypothetical protein
MAKRKRPKYYVFHLGGDHPPQDPLRPYEIQVLDPRGRAKLVGYIGSSEIELVLGGCAIPIAVLEAARNLPEGEGDTLDSSGKSTSPFWWIPESKN